MNSPGHIERNTHVPQKTGGRALMLGALVCFMSVPDTAKASPGSARDELASPMEGSGTAQGDRITMDIGAFSYAPLAIGGGLEFEIPGHFVFRLFGGTVPDFFVNAVNGVARDYSIYGTSTAELLGSFTRGSVVLEAAAGVRPFGTNGLELLVGYMLFWSTPTMAAGQLGLPDSMGGTIPVNLSVYAVHAELSFCFDLFDFISVRMGAGWIHAVDQHVNFGLDPAIRAAAAANVDQVEAGFENRIQQYGRGPVVDVSLGIRL